MFFRDKVDRLVEVTFTTKRSSYFTRGAKAISSVCENSRRAQRMVYGCICNNTAYLETLKSSIEGWSNKGVLVYMYFVGELGPEHLLLAQVLVGDLAMHNPEISRQLLEVLNVQLKPLLHELDRAMVSCFKSECEAPAACIAVVGLCKMILTLFVDVCEVGWSRKELSSTTYVVDANRVSEQYPSGTVGITWKKDVADRVVENTKVETSDGCKSLLDLLLLFIHRAVYQPEMNEALYAALELVHAVTVNDMYNDPKDRRNTVRELIHVASTEQFVTGSEEVVQRRMISGRKCKVEALNVLHSIKDLQLHHRVLTVVAGHRADEINDALLNPGMNLVEKCFNALRRTTDPSLEESLASMLLRLHVTHTELKRSLLRVHYVEEGQMELLESAQKWAVELARILDEPEVDMLLAARATGQLRASLVPDDSTGLTK